MLPYKDNLKLLAKGEMLAGNFGRTFPLRIVLNLRATILEAMSESPIYGWHD